MSEFFRFPHTPHLAWLGADMPRDDKVMSPREASEFLSGQIVAEEKLDGANLGISLGPDGSLRVQNRGQYLEPPFRGQFSRLSSWLEIHQDGIVSALAPGSILFGEWCTARHSLEYDALPDWFLVFDLYDSNIERFSSTRKRNDLATKLGLSVVPRLFAGTMSIADLKLLLRREPSRFRKGPLEGIIVRKENDQWLEARAKLVHPDFTQAISEHWSRRAIEWNRLRSDDHFQQRR